jgi:hypothetical protein
VLLRYTKYGDSNLDGTIDIGNDFNLLLDGLAAASGSSWVLGDYSYDGKIDLGNDFNLFLRNYLAGTPQSPQAISVAAAPSAPAVAAQPVFSAVAVDVSLLTLTKLDNETPDFFA